MGDAVEPRAPLPAKDSRSRPPHEKRLRPPGFKPSGFRTEPFTRPGKNPMEPFAEQGVQRVTDTATGEVYEIRGHANADEFVVTKLSTGDQIVWGRDGTVRGATPGPGRTPPPDDLDVSFWPPSTALAPTSPGGLLPAGPAVGPMPGTASTAPAVGAVAPGWWANDAAIATRVDALEEAIAIEMSGTELRAVLDLQPNAAAVEHALARAEATWERDPRSLWRELETMLAEAQLARLPVRNGVRVRSTADQFWIEDAVNPNLYARAEIEGGDLVLDFQTKGLAGERGVLYGQQSFRDALAYFDGRFTAVRGTWSFWATGQRDNLNLFNQALRDNKSMAEAAFATKTGEWAFAEGYTKVQIVEKVESEVLGAYDEVVVRFTR